MKVREVIKLLEEDGWYQARMRGSHRQFKHFSKTGTVTVAGKPNVDIPPGTFKYLEASWPQEVSLRCNTR